MNRFHIVDGLPYLIADGKYYSCRWKENQFTVGAEVKDLPAPSWVYSEREVLAKCSCVDSIGHEGTNTQSKPSKDIEDMTVAELRQYANNIGIELRQRASKAEIITAIKTAE